MELEYKLLKVIFYLKKCLKLIINIIQHFIRYTRNLFKKCLEIVYKLHKIYCIK